jgi:Fur family peroxide stress response transcriptional regulator
LHFFLFVVIIITVIIININRVKNDMTEKVRKHSKKRDAILDVIKSTKSHPGAQWVYDQLKPAIPDLSLGTVYRNISMFKEEGTLVSQGVVNGEERFDSTTLPHPHAVCTRCGRMDDLSGEVQAKILTEFDIEIPGFAIDKRHTVFYGLCRDCEKFETETAALGR